MKRRCFDPLNVHLLLALTLVPLGGLPGRAAEPIVASLSRNGGLVCSNLAPGSIARVEWAASALGPWNTNWATLEAVAADTNGTIQVSVPMFYRVRGIPKTDRYYVVINEVQTAGSGGAADEFLELYNPGANSVDLSGSRLVYRSASGSTDITLVTFTNSIAPGGYLLLGGSGYAGGVQPDGGWSSGGLAAAGGAVALRNVANEVVDSVAWGTAQNGLGEGTAAPALAPGQSLGRSPDGVDTDNNLNDFRITAAPTPRASN